MSNLLGASPSVNQWIFAVGTVNNRLLGTQIGIVLLDVNYFWVSVRQVARGTPDLRTQNPRTKFLRNPLTVK